MLFSYFPQKCIYDRNINKNVENTVFNFFEIKMYVPFYINSKICDLKGPPLYDTKNVSLRIPRLKISWTVPIRAIRSLKVDNWFFSKVFTFLSIKKIRKTEWFQGEKRKGGCYPAPPIYIDTSWWSETVKYTVYKFQNKEK